jgi:hypothetical protein
LGSFGSWEAEISSSGTYAFAPSTGQCVITAFGRVQIRMPSLGQEHFNTAFMEQNLCLVKFSNLQPNLWAVDLQTVTLTPGVATITIPGNTVLVLDAYITTNPGSQFGQNNRYITQLSRTQYASLSNPNSPGAPTQIWFNRQIIPTISFWPVPDNNGPYTFSYYRAVQLQDAKLPNGETPNLPYRWYDAYVCELAWRFAMHYKPELEAQREAQAIKSWDIAAGQDTEAVNLSVAPSLSRYYPR